MDRNKGIPSSLTAYRVQRELDLGPVGIVLATVNGDISWCNDKALALLGLTRGEVEGTQVPESLHRLRNEATGQFRITCVHRPLQTSIMLFGLCMASGLGETYYLVDAESLGSGIDHLARRESVWNLALESAGHGVWEFDYTRPIQTQGFFSDEWRRMRGLAIGPESSAVEGEWIDRVHPDDKARALELLRQQDEGETKEFSFEYRERCADGHYIWVLARGRVTGLNPQGKPIHVVGTDIDITAIKQAEAGRAEAQASLYRQHLSQLEAAKREAELNAFRESIWRQAVGGAGHGVWSYTIDYSTPTPSTTVIFASDEWFKIRGASTSSHELHDFDVWVSRIHPDDLDYVLRCTNRQMSGEVREVSFEYRERHAAGHWVWILARGTSADFDDNGRPTRIIGIDIDISSVKAEEERRAEEAGKTYRQHLAVLQKANLEAEEARREAQYLARTDVATGLPNRRMFREKVDELLAQNKIFSVFLIDLDHFKEVNDLHGHAAGDHVLRHSATRLREAVSEDGFVARLGGDEFGAVLVHDDKLSPQRLQLAASRIVSSVSRPLELADLLLNVGASIGASSFPSDAQDYDTLLQHADLALYSVKAGERGQLAFYSAAMGEETRQKAQLEADLRIAIEQEHIEPWFQPILSAGLAAPNKLEILARWHHPKWGSVPPDKFIEVAEHIGMLPQLTASVLRKSCEHARLWPAIGLSMNISAREACDPATPLRILETLNQCQFPPHLLDVEVTEHALIKDLDAARQVVAALRSVGITVYIDDFGEGYSGIGYLRELVIDGIKIDRSCVKDICNNEQAAVFLKSLLLMANALGCKTVAEGIETLDVWQKAKEIGVDFGQGYFFAKPMPASEVGRFLQISPEIASGRVLAFSRP